MHGKRRVLGRTKGQVSYYGAGVYECSEMLLSFFDVSVQPSSGF